MNECFICGRKDKKLDRHHVNYKLNSAILVCRSCHLIIHKTDKFIYFKPVDPPLRDWGLVRIQTKTKKRLDKLGSKNDSYDDIIQRLLNKNKVGG